jgi:energy-coupling factor transport system substrate-specific component
MTWQLGAFAVLALALAGGFAWYERAKPDGRIIALVATLAAFAAIGRIAFAAFPNVKPTSDIILISGYALGGGPGFVVGAVAGLTSNFFFGQGPWTPWQMAAWGATGLVGAGLAMVTRDRIGRWPLALVCAAAGFAFTAIQDIGDWVTYSDHSLSQLGAYVGTGVGFDVIYSVGCAGFALVFGPWLLHAIQRFARRLEVTWLPSTAAAPLVLVVAAAATGALLTSQPAARAASMAASSAGSTPTAYLLAAQNQDGGFGGAPGQASSTLFSGWVALGLAAEGHNPAEVKRGGTSLLSYEEEHAGESDPGSIERTLMVAAASGVPATDFGGRNLVAALQRDVRKDGSISEQTNLTAFAVLALRAGGVQPSARTLSWLVRQQDADGGFSFTTAGGGSDVDDTGAVLEALAGVGGPAARSRGRAVHFIRAQEKRDGGLPPLPGGTSNAQSTAWAVQGLIAAGADAGAPLRYLSSLVAPDGHVRYSRAIDQTPVWVTGEALMALAHKPLPLAAVPRAVAPRAPAKRKHPHQPPHETRSRARHPAGKRPEPSPNHPRRPGQADQRMRTLLADIAAVAALALAPVGG